MTTRICTALERGASTAARLGYASLALCAALLLAPSASATVAAKLRVLTPDQTLDPGTTYIVDEGVTVPTRPDADCFGPPGGSGAEFTYDKPNVLSLLATAGRTTKAVAPLALTDQFEFGLGICAIGGVKASMGEQFWYFKVNHAEASVGADQLELKPGDEALFYLAPEAFPNPNPAELELTAPPRAQAGQPFSVSVTEHKCVTSDSPPFDTSCASTPAAGVTVSGGDTVATTGPDGTTQVAVSAAGEAQLTAARATDIPSETLATCVAEALESCPAERGVRLVGSPQADKIKGTAGSDSIRSRGGNDKVDVRSGGADVVNCGKGADKVKLKRSSEDEIVVKSSCEKVARRSGAKPSRAAVEAPGSRR